MAELNIAAQQLKAIAALRLRLLINSLRSIRGRLNLISRLFAGLLVLGAGVGGGIAIGSAAWGIAKSGDLEWLALPFWLIFLFWQLFPLLATAFHQNVDTSGFLRFPLSYSNYFLVQLIYGALDIATGLGVCWSLGLLVGLCVADVRLTPWAIATVAVFCILNLLLARTIFVWIEHWLSRRRSKEVLGVIFLLLMICFQVAGPVLGRYSKQSMPQRLQVIKRLVPVERVLPAGLPAMVLADVHAGRYRDALFLLSLLAAMGLVTFQILHSRLRDQFRGENPAGGEQQSTQSAVLVIRRGWSLPGLGGTLNSIFEKEIRYFSRSGPMLFTLIMPMIMVFVLWGGRRAFMDRPMNYVFPVGTAYCLMVMTNIVYNSFGGDGGGIQFFFVSPVTFKKIAIGKNLAQLTVLALDVSFLLLGVSAIYQPPKFRVLALTFSWLLFAVPLSFGIGNLLSIYSPKRIDYATFGRQRAAETTILVSLAVHLGTIGIGALVVFLAQHFYHTLWVATLVLSALSICTIIGYFIVLKRIDGIALQCRDVLLTELCRA
jgi:hypothetical protein